MNPHHFPRPYVRLAGRGPSDTGSSAPRPDETQLEPHTPLSLLIVDDVEDTRDLYQHYFQFCGARVVTAADGVAALQAISFDPPDAIVLDLAMPRMAGWEVIERLKANPRTRTIPIVVLSGQNARDSALTAGAEAYLEKPCLPERLLSEVLRVLRECTRGTQH